MVAEKINLVDHVYLMKELESTHDSLLNLIGKEGFHYLDIPVHNNVGDLLIMYGTLSYFNKNKIKPISIYSAHNFSGHNISNKNTLVFHGGGNFGDLYHIHQNHRLDIISKYNKNKIIILPQTIYYESEQEYKECCVKLRKHDDLHICVRDEDSYQLALGMTDNVYLMPDMAHQLYKTKLLESDIDLKEGTALFVNRVDREAVSINIKIDVDLIIDWNSLLDKYQHKVQLEDRLQRLSNLSRLNRFTSNNTTKRWLKLSEQLVKEAVDLFSSYEKIYTSRLHGCILSVLMEKETYVFDNSYGKNSAYVNKWLEKSPLLKLVNN